MISSETAQLVKDAIDFTGSSGPDILDADAPVLRDQVIADTDDDGLYLIGLIGGKEVGKSALVNALAGSVITAQTSHGPGTQTVIAYVHHDREKQIRDLLQKETPGRFSIVLHRNDRLSRQVLLDLPDIDSRFADHVEITRRMLRHMLFPIWIQSVEKYADAQPQNLLAKVGAGNDPSNFLFCLNKVDQLSSADELAEIRADYAKRLARVLRLPADPRVYMISAIKPMEFDLPELLKLLSREKTSKIVRQSKDLAGQQRQRSLLGWLENLNLSQRAAEIARLDEEASEMLSQRVGVPLMELAIPSLLEDAGYRQVMTDGVLARRVARWPIVNVVHSLLSPLRIFVRENSAAGLGFNGPAALVDSHLPTGSASIASLVQSTFAQLHQSHPRLASLYAQQKPWESMDAETAEARLRTELLETVQRQRDVVMSRLAGRAGIIAPFFRVLLTIGALLWFPLVQPVLAAMLPNKGLFKTASDIGLLLVQIMSAEFLLKSLGFLALWYLLLWALIRWDTRRRVDRLLARWKTAKQPDPSLNLSTRTLQWLDDLLEPIRSARQTIEKLVERVSELRKKVDAEKKSAA
jgi:GTPase Era involved in 16S rRNA processing